MSKSNIGKSSNMDDLVEIIQAFNNCLIHTQYLLNECSHQFPDRSSLRALQNDLSENIDRLKNLSESKTKD